MFSFSNFSNEKDLNESNQPSSQKQPLKKRANKIDELISNYSEICENAFYLKYPQNIGHTEISSDNGLYECLEKNNYFSFRDTNKNKIEKYLAMVDTDSNVIQPYLLLNFTYALPINVANIFEYQLFSLLLEEKIYDEKTIDGFKKKFNSLISSKLQSFQDNLLEFHQKKDMADFYKKHGENTHLEYIESQLHEYQAEKKSSDAFAKGIKEDFSKRLERIQLGLKIKKPLSPNAKACETLLLLSFEEFNRDKNKYNSFRKAVKKFLFPILDKSGSSKTLDQEKKEEPNNKQPGCVIN